MNTLDTLHRAAAHDPESLTGKYLTFGLSREEYGLPVLKVREIIKVMHITPLPQAPAYVRGVIDLRGKVIPIVDLRMKFGLEAREFTERTCIIVVDINLAAGRVLQGIIVDSVSEVLSLTASEIDDAPDFGDGMRTDYVRGLAKVKGTVKILLDLDRVLGGEGLAEALA